VQVPLPLQRSAAVGLTSELHGGCKDGSTDGWKWQRWAPLIELGDLLQRIWDVSGLVSVAALCEAMRQWPSGIWSDSQQGSKEVVARAMPQPFGKHVRRR